MLGPEIHCSRGAPAGSHSSGRFRIRQPPASGYEAISGQVPLPAPFSPGVWNSAVTNGIFIRFGNVELSHDEVLTMAGQDT